MVERKRFTDFLAERELFEVEQAIKVSPETSSKSKAANQAAGKAVGRAIQSTPVDLSKAGAPTINRIVGQSLRHAVSKDDNVNAMDIAQKINPRLAL